MVSNRNYFWFAVYNLSSPIGARLLVINWKWPEETAKKSGQLHIFVCNWPVGYCQKLKPKSVSFLVEIDKDGIYLLYDISKISWVYEKKPTVVSFIT